MKQTLIAYVQDEPMVLNRIVGLLWRRGFAIEGIALGPSERPGVIRMTLLVEAAVIEQVVRQLNRLVPVINVTETSAADTLERETALVSVQAPVEMRAAVVALCMATSATVLAVGERTMVVEITAAPNDVERFLELVRRFGVQELARSGRIAMLRPDASSHDSPVHHAQAPASAHSTL